MAWLWGRRVRSRAVGQMRAWRVCGAERIESGLWGGWEHALAVGQVMVDGGTARVRGGQAGDVAMGQAATHRRPRAQPALWHHSPCPNQRPHLPTLLGPLPPRTLPANQKPGSCDITSHQAGSWAESPSSRLCLQQPGSTHGCTHLEQRRQVVAPWGTAMPHW